VAGRPQPACKYWDMDNSYPHLVKLFISHYTSWHDRPQRGVQSMEAFKVRKWITSSSRLTSNFVSSWGNWLWKCCGCITWNMPTNYVLV
jgi:hypothetical protein